MNKFALKSFATSARKELLKKVAAKAMKIGITEEKIKKADIESSDAIFIDGKQLSKEEKIQREKLIARINQNGFNQVMEEVAYTWFNRFTALRFMEVNDYLPTGVRVLSSSNPSSADPDMLNEALELDLELDKVYVYELKLNNKIEELFKYLIIKHCNDLNKYLPFMFETINNYTEILFPEGLLGKDSFIRQMTDTEFIPGDNWKKVEVIGWLYQYYIAEEKDRVIKAKKKYKTEEIPFATQLFTPDWIVRYMVQNTLGRYWVESHPEHRDLLGNWEFYLENPNAEQDFEEKLAPYINKELKVEDIKCFDPAMGSGHILVYMFDVLYEIYVKCGYMEREIPRLILENNLYGLDIDDRAYQLSCFSVVMKALEYNNRFFRSIEREGLTLNLAAIQETNMLVIQEIEYLAGDSSGENFAKMKVFLDQFINAKTIGSLIKLELFDYDFLQDRLKKIEKQVGDLFEIEMKDRLLSFLKDIIKQSLILNKQYDVLVTNPPYAGNKYLPLELNTYLTKQYPDVKLDLFSAFLDYSFNTTKSNGQMGFITPFVWMFISSFEKVRKKIVKEKNISSLVQLEYNGFESAVVPVCLFSIRNYQVDIAGEYIRLSDYKGIENQPIKTLEAVQNPSVTYRYSYNQKEYKNIPQSPIAYWITPKAISAFKKGILFENLAKPKAGLTTGNNNLFQRLWYEVNFYKIGFDYKEIKDTEKDRHKWFPCNSGGEYRKWSTNDEYIVDWEKNGRAIKEYRNENGKLAGRPQNTQFYLKKGLTWNKLSNANFSVKFKREGFIFDDTSRSAFIEQEEKLYYLIGFLCSKICFEYLKMLNPTMSFTNGDLERIPIIYSEKHAEKIDALVKENIEISKMDWDSFETSWDYIQNPLIKYKDKTSRLKTAFENWSSFSEFQHAKLKMNEEEINRIFLEIYELQKDLNPVVEEKDITIRKADLHREIKSYISYAVGCIYGRYSVDEEGLIYAGGKFDPSRYKNFKVDKDNVLPILSGAYFEDDILTRFIKFVEVTFGKETLNENIMFIANTLGMKKGETAKETIRRYFLNDFFKDHVQTYKKRPIYWLFTSGKQKAFNCLIYMHRYDKTTLSRIRTDYLHEYQIRLDAEKRDLLSIIEGDYSTKEISNAKKELKTLDKKIEELKEYDELLHHIADMQKELDLDDGVTANYEKFKGLVANYN
ncbi:BREX-1 system adenine-specific DNA-methyltransferase PglX [Fictibacillus arsenicus]|uniref:site-specific DNA-methyltransferase (adenine-specific) n=1 Tax=Fictibacillus arsenicus TaxID=255247 RepID=A0A1V3G7Y8_9BACL|nr:BREX-1 system adenine-specific DNA-methyltransferase PglX [Fictibacillus arsenicus]OOE12495.1 SAM-dependent methyltransferase [Fictibacillus arsenicus]